MSSNILEDKGTIAMHESELAQFKFQPYRLSLYVIKCNRFNVIVRGFDRSMRCPNAVACLSDNLFIYLFIYYSLFYKMPRKTTIAFSSEDD